MMITCFSTGIGLFCGCLSTSTMRAPCSRRFLVSASKSEPNCENACSSRNCEYASLSVPATFFIALICALPPTRDTEIPGFTAGRIPELNSSVSRKI